jgi:hypothetical protein
LHCNILLIFSDIRTIDDVENSVDDESLKKAFKNAKEEDQFFKMTKNAFLPSE